MSKAKRSRARQARAHAAALRRARETRRRRRRVGFIGSTVVGVVAVVAVVIVAIGRSGDGDGLDAVKSFDVRSEHVQGQVDYPQTPPAGGPHNARWLTCGVYDEPVPNENAVHSLEHGAVWVTYRPDLSSAQVEKLRGKVEGRTYLVLSPYPDLPAPVVASAWGKQLTLTGADDPGLTEFIREFRQGPQTPEPGAPCTGGVGSPQ